MPSRSSRPTYSKTIFARISNKKNSTTSLAQITPKSHVSLNLNRGLSFFTGFIMGRLHAPGYKKSNKLNTCEEFISHDNCTNIYLDYLDCIKSTSSNSHCENLYEQLKNCENQN